MTEVRGKTLSASVYFMKKESSSPPSPTRKEKDWSYSLLMVSTTFLICCRGCPTSAVRRSATLMKIFLGKTISAILKFYERNFRTLRKKPVNSSQNTMP